nr:MAG: hypothetical protein [Bacteriophage sp.]
MLPVLRDIASGRDKMGKILATYDQNMGAVNRLNEERLKTDAGVIDQFESSLENLTVTAGAALGRIFTPVLNVGNSIINVIDSISETWAGSFALRVGATAVVIGTIVAGFNTVRGIIRSVGYLQTIATASTEGMSAAAIKTNTQFAIMEAHMISMVNLMRTMVQLQMMMGGVSMNRAGRFYNTKTGRYVKTPNPGMSPATSLIGGVVGGTVANQAGKQAAKTVATRSLASVGGRLLGLIGGPWGLAITVGLPLLIEVGSRLIDSVDRNTNAQDKGKEDSTTIRAQNEERFINAVRLAIKEGMRDSRINISVDGQAVGDYAPGSQQDFTGAAFVMGL